MSAMVPLVIAAAGLYRSVSGQEWAESIAKTFYWLNDVRSRQYCGGDLEERDCGITHRLLRYVYLCDSHRCGVGRDRQ